MQVEAVVSGNSVDVIKGHATLLCDEEILLFLEGGKFLPLENDDGSTDLNTAAAARLEWRPDVDFCRIEDLIKPRPMSRVAFQLIETLAYLSIIEVHSQISGLDISIEHMKKFKIWLELQISRLNAGQVTHIEKAQALLNTDVRERAVRIIQLRKEATKTDGAAIAESINRVVDNFKDLATGQVDGMEILLHDNALTNVYALLESRTDAQDFYILCGHENPNLRVLEIGAGTGGSTVAALKGLTRPNGERMYSSYR
jgi:hypothetical protein